MLNYWVNYFSVCMRSNTKTKSPEINTRRAILKKYKNIAHLMITCLNGNKSIEIRADHLMGSQSHKKMDTLIWGLKKVKTEFLLKCHFLLLVFIFLPIWVWWAFGELVAKPLISSCVSDSWCSDKCFLFPELGAFDISPLTSGDLNSHSPPSFSALLSVACCKVFLPELVSICDECRKLHRVLSNHLATWKWRKNRKFRMSQAKDKLCSLLSAKLKDMTCWQVSPSSCAKLSFVVLSGYWFSLKDMWSLWKYKNS